MKNRTFAVAATLLLSIACAESADDLDAAKVDVDSPQVVAFIDEMVSDHEFDRDALRGVLSQAAIKPSIIRKISSPAERTLTWAEYRKIFITKERINAGVTFWRENLEMLERISKESGVSIEMIVGIIGVETYFGRITGNDRVLDALATLAFEYPKRARFFRNELVQFLILAREEGLDATTPTGSYAGAMGRPQFMPSSFRAYAVDATGDGKRDIWNDWADVSGSVANYFLEHGWRTGEEVTARATLSAQWKGPVPKPRNTLKAADTVESLSKKGVVFATDLCADSKGELLTYEGNDGAEHWVGFHNFFVITKYNRSVMYALAAHQLGQEIASKVAIHAS
ncbi:MAG: lytic murein transglycosylase B [Gammaproteobacteria bacterium]|nr:lytic murein transglycosylase B [Gammaproteobacteria bacterium]MDH3362732.1 lytic murein transglycosylase B [Gammaproteobacteria bacterium]MDH3480647.1 lytic murein transglycosylase B [Gammaproteobacteria bacterium]